MEIHFQKTLLFYFAFLFTLNGTFLHLLTLMLFKTCKNLSSVGQKKIILKKSLRSNVVSDPMAFITWTKTFFKILLYNLLCSSEERKS